MISATSPKHATSQEAPGTDPADPAAAWREAWSELQGCPWPKLRPLMDVFGHLQDVRRVLEVESPGCCAWKSMDFPEMIYIGGFSICKLAKHLVLPAPVGLPSSYELKTW